MKFLVVLCSSLRHSSPLLSSDPIHKSELLINRYPFCKRIGELLTPVLGIRPANGDLTHSLRWNFKIDTQQRISFFYLNFNLISSRLPIIIIYWRCHFVFVINIILNKLWKIRICHKYSYDLLANVEIEKSPCPNRMTRKMEIKAFCDYWFKYKRNFPYSIKELIIIT